MNYSTLEAYFTLLSDILYDLTRYDLAFGDKIRTTISKLGEFLGISRISIFEDSPDNKTTSNVYEWCNNGLYPRMDHFQDFPYTIIPSWNEMLTKDGYIFASDINDLNDDLRAVLEPQAIKSILVYPLYTGEKQIGFIRFDECLINRSWEENTFKLLKTISNLFSNEYQRKFDNEKLVNSKLAAEAGSRAKELFLANMSHEIRTPMNVIVGMGNLLDGTKLDEKQSGYLQAIRTSSENLLVIINDILDFSKIQAGKIELESIPFDLRELVHIALRSQSLRASEKNLIMECDFDDQIPAGLLGDPFRLNQILLNLLNNAVKFTMQGSIILTCRLVKETIFDVTIRFEIKDTGQGIDREKAEQIFESFQQGDPSVTRKFGGTGLGLTITKKLVSLFGGTIDMQSDIGKGTTFLFTITFLKAEDQAETIKEKHFIDKNLLKGQRILLVEDNEFNRLVVFGLLEQWNVDTEVAENGKIALEKLSSTRYDLILMDIQMPVMDGIEATGIIRKKMKLDLPIIALTANALKSDKEKYLESGMNEYITKPFTPQELFLTIARVLNLASPMLTSNLIMESIKNNTVKLYDLAGLEKISYGDNSFILKMISLFLSQSEENITKLREFSAAGNFDQVKAVVHKMKPSVTILGITSIKELIDEIEQIDSQSGSTDELTGLSAKLESVLFAVCEHLKYECPVD